MTDEEIRKKRHSIESRRWEKKHPEKKRQYSLKYRKKIAEKSKYIKDKYGLGASTIAIYTFRLALKIYEKYDRKCSECGEDKDLTIHHLDNQGRNIQEKGGEMNNDENNLTLLCRRCHGRIHGKQSGLKRRKGGKDSEVSTL